MKEKKAKKIQFKRSFSLWERASQLIPNGTQCFSKGPSQFSLGACPIYLKKGNGAKITDVDDNEYIDFGMGLHPVILGYGYPAVTDAIIQALKDGITLTLMHPLEVEVSEILVDRIRSAERVRFAKTGSEATSVSVRIARIMTGREHIVSCGYHGWHDWFLGITERSAGIPNAVKGLVSKFNYNDIQSLEKIFSDRPNQVAAVIMEPCGVVPPKNDFLNQCKEVAHRNGALFILDETITGIRWDEGGAQSLFKVSPDLSIFGKSIANGMPLSAIVGKKEYMDALKRPDAFFSSTYAGEFASLAAAKATLQTIREQRVIPFIWEQGKKLMEGFNALVEKHELSHLLEMAGYPCRPVTLIKSKNNDDPLVLKSYLQQECAKRGLLYTGYFAMSLAHTDDIIEDSLQIFEDVFGKFKQRVEENRIRECLEGEIVSPVFRNL